MGGAPGSSKGCYTCRRRKKGCDLQRPACGRCLKARLQCSGYERQWVFVNATTSADGRELPVSRTPPDVTLPVSLARSAYQNKYLDVFWSMYLPSGLDSASLPSRYSVRTWVPAARDLHQSEPALHKALLALCCATIGRKKGYAWMAQESLKFYVGSIRDLNAGLKSPARRKSDALMLATKALGLYELLYGPDESGSGTTPRAAGWHGHNLGQMALILQRTPEMHIDGYAHELFVDGRMNLATSSIVLRKRCPLNDHRWSTIPWTKRPKTPQDFLVDILCEISGLLEDADSAYICCEPSKRGNLVCRLVEDCWAVDSRLVRWSETHGAQGYIEGLLARGFACPTATDFAIAYLMSRYWTACILAYSTLRAAIRLHPLSAPSSLPERTDPHVYCRSAIDVAGIFFHPAAGAFGLPALLLPFGVSFLYLLSTEEGTPSPEMRKALAYFKLGALGAEVQKLIGSMLLPTPVLTGTARDDLDLLRAKGRAWFGAASLLDRSNQFDSISDGPISSDGNLHP